MKLSRNFSKHEFDSKDGSEMPYEVFQNVLKLAQNLQRLRDAINLPININSGYRSQEHNAKIGGVKNSQHLTGKAADIRVVGTSPKIVAKKIEELIKLGIMQEGGLGIYDTFVHYDIRGEKARW